MQIYVYIYIHVYVYLEPTHDLYCLKVHPSKQSHLQLKQKSFGFQICIYICIYSLNYLTIYYMYIYICIQYIYIYTIYDVKCRRRKDANIPTYHLKSVCWNCVLFCLLPTPKKWIILMLDRFHHQRWRLAIHIVDLQDGDPSFKMFFKIKLRSIHTPSKQAVLNPKRKPDRLPSNLFQVRKCEFQGRYFGPSLPSQPPGYLARVAGAQRTKNPAVPGFDMICPFWAMNHETGNRPPWKTKKKHCVCVGLNKYINK